MDMLTTAFNAIYGAWSYFFNAIFSPSWNNYFYWLIAISVFAWSLELIIPWRKGQKQIRKDFWLDGFYMFFNFFFFYMIGFAAFSTLAEQLFTKGLALFNIDSINFVDLSTLPQWGQLLIYFIIADFTHWNIHRLLHRVPWLWEFHKVHHSVEEMGFAAHLRFHWMENVVYKGITYFPIALIGGFELEQVFIVHIIQTTIGHLNHANIPWTYGPLKYIFNNPAMHIWHHAKTIPEGKHGVNFGISLSLWDYIFKTDYIPHNGRDIKLGFEHSEQFPKRFIKQFVWPFKR